MRQFGFYPNKPEICFLSSQFGPPLNHGKNPLCAAVGMFSLVESVVKTLWQSYKPFICLGILCFHGLLCAEDGSSFVVMNAKTGKILLQQNAHRKQYPASTTKIATVAYALSANPIDLDQKLVVPAEAVKAVSEGEKAKDNYGKHPSYILSQQVALLGFRQGRFSH